MFPVACKWTQIHFAYEFILFIFVNYGRNMSFKQLIKQDIVLLNGMNLCENFAIMVEKIMEPF